MLLAKNDSLQLQGYMIHFSLMHKTNNYSKNKPQYTTMEDLKKRIQACTRCPLHKTRNRVIFGEGNHKAAILLVGEAPGADEDRVGRPFIGKSGQLLEKIIGVCGFTRKEHVFLSNIVRCRPPGNRIPTSEETEACLPYLLEQIELIDPKIIITLGATPLKTLTGNNAYKITKVRGRWLNWNNRLLIPVYHPAALLRNPNLKQDTWTDFKEIVHKYRELINSSHSSDYV